MWHSGGSFVLVSIVEPTFAAVVVAILLVYLHIAAFYRASARELKRLDNVLRSTVYSVSLPLLTFATMTDASDILQHFAESLSGLASVRAFGVVKVRIL